MEFFGIIRGIRKKDFSWFFIDEKKIDKLEDSMIFLTLFDKKK